MNNRLDWFVAVAAIVLAIGGCDENAAREDAMVPEEEAMSNEKGGTEGHRDQGTK